MSSRTDGVLVKNQKQDSARKLRISTTPANKVKDSYSNGLMIYDNQGTTIEVTVKTKDRIESPAIMNGKSSVEKKRQANSSKTPTNWAQIFREQSRLATKGSIQPLTGRTQLTTKTSRISPTDVKKAPEKRQCLKYNAQTDKLLDEFPEKLPASHKKSSECFRNPDSIIPSTTSIISSAQRIIVFDKGIQCGGIFDCSSGSLSLLDPIRTLGFLMKELERSVKDEKSSKILMEMEQALMRIPTEHGKLTPDELKELAMRNNLQAATTQLETMSKEMEAMYKALKKDKEKLVQQNREQAILLDQANRRGNELECLIKRLRADLNEANVALKSDLENRKIINDLKGEIRELKTEINEQTDAAQHARLEVQFLKLEREKLSVMSSFKDSQMVEHRKAVKDLQNLIQNQLASLKETSFVDRATSNPEISTVIRGRGSSSPTRQSSNNSIVPLSWRDGSQFSISTIDPRAEPNDLPINSTSLTRQQSMHTLEDVLNQSGKEKFKEKTHLEFTSIAGDETSRPTTAIHETDDTTYKDLLNVDEADHTKQPSFPYKDSDNEVERALFNLRLSSERKRSKSKSRKSFKNEKNNKSSQQETSEKDFSSCDHMDDLKEVKMMFENVRLRNQVSVKVPSPPRSYPYPDWTDSSLPTMSITESNPA